MARLARGRAGPGTRTLSKRPSLGAKKELTGMAYSSAFRTDTNKRTDAVAAVRRADDSTENTSLWHLHGPRPLPLSGEPCSLRAGPRPGPQECLAWGGGRGMVNVSCLGGLALVLTWEAAEGGIQRWRGCSGTISFSFFFPQFPVHRMFYAETR